MAPENYTPPMYLTKRRLRPERMDDPDVDRDELGRALRFLARTNRVLGGTRSIVNLFRRWSADWRPGETIRVLDVGTGSADLPVDLVDWARGSGFDLRVTAVDLHPRTLEFARERVDGREGIDLVQANAVELTDRFDVDSFDYAHAGLFLHHLEDLDVMTVLRMMQRLSTRAVVWNDLVRSRLTKLAIRPFAMLGPPIFRHDALASFEAGFTRAEAIDLARRVGLENIRYRQILFHRFILTSEHAS